MSKATVAIVGSPNVGKSTIFNRMLGEKFAIVFGLMGAEYETAEFFRKSFEEKIRKKFWG